MDTRSSFVAISNFVARAQGKDLVGWSNPRPERIKLLNYMCANLPEVPSEKQPALVL